MSLWCLMAAPLMISCDIGTMNERTKQILTNKEIIAIDQDELSVQAQRRISNDTFQIFIKPLQNKGYALGILNLSPKKNIIIYLQALGINAKQALDVWEHQNIAINKRIIKLKIVPYETKVLRLQ